LAWAEWLVVQKLESRLDFVMPYLLLPAAFVVVFAVDRYVTDTYAGPDGFWWTNFVVVAVFTIAVLWGRMAVTEVTEATRQS
jgi:Na+/H+ antiporter NhaC